MAFSDVQFINNSVVVGNTTTVVSTQKDKRMYIILTNDSDETIYLAIGEAASGGKGIRLNASGGAYGLEPEDILNFQINAICASGGKNLCITEVYQNLV